MPHFDLPERFLKKRSPGISQVTPGGRDKKKRTDCTSTSDPLGWNTPSERECLASASSTLPAISFKSERPKDAKGPKTKLLALVPRKGSITFKALKTKAEAAGLSPNKVLQYTAAMAKAGRVELA